MDWMAQDRPGHDRARQARARQVLGMQTGDFRPPPDAATVRKHLYALLDAPDAAERGLPGCVITEYKRCGKARCRSATGRPHGPYYYWNGRVFGITWKKYVSRAGAPRVAALCQLRREKRVTRAKAREAIRVLRRLWAQVEDYL
jgi:hypothetical protein